MHTYTHTHTHIYGGADRKVIIERLCISLPYAETFNSKVIKGFVPELRSRHVFFVFRDSYVLCIYVMNIIYTFRISRYLAMVYGELNSLEELLGFLFLPLSLSFYHSYNTSVSISQSP